MEPPRKKGRKLAHEMRDQIAVWNFKVASRVNVAIRSAAADASAFSIQWGKQSNDTATNRSEFTARSRTLELSRVSIELHQVSISTFLLSVYPIV